MWPIDQLVMVGWACCRSRMAASGHLAPCRTSPPRWACTRRPDPLDSQLLYLGQLRFIVVHWFKKMKKYHSSLALDHRAAMQIIATPKLLAHLSDLSASRIKFSADFDLGVSVLYHFIGASKVIFLMLNFVDDKFNMCAVPSTEKPSKDKKANTKSANEGRCAETLEKKNLFGKPDPW